jgi:hypothetical protein
MAGFPMNKDGAHLTDRSSRFQRLGARQERRNHANDEMASGNGGDRAGDDGWLFATIQRQRWCSDLTGQ